MKILTLCCLTCILTEINLPAQLPPMPPKFVMSEIPTILPAPPAGHRWKTNHLTVQMLEAEPIPAPKWFYGVGAEGTWICFGAFETAEAFHRSQFGAGQDPQFVEHWDTILAADQPLGVVKPVWQFKPGFHARQLPPPNPSGIHFDTTNTQAGLWVGSMTNTAQSITKN